MQLIHNLKPTLRRRRNGFERKTAAIVCLVSLIIFTLAARQAYRHTLGGFERTVFDAAYNLSDGLRWLFLLITQFGSGWMVVGIVVILIGLRTYRLAFQFGSRALVAYLLVELVKEIIARPRPIFLDAHIQQREIWVQGLGFPSGHTAIIMVAAMVFWPVVSKGYRWLLIVGVVLVGLSRVYLGVHAPLDIVGGAAIGLMVSMLPALAKRRGKQPQKTLKKDVIDVELIHKH